MHLAAALRYSNHQIVAFVGAGGKTTALFQLARELARAERPFRFRFDNISAELTKRWFYRQVKNHG